MGYNGVKKSHAEYLEELKAAKKPAPAKKAKKKAKK